MREITSRTRRSIGDPIIAIYVELNEPTPCVVSTATRPLEHRQLEAWLCEHPQLQELVQWALELADPDKGGAEC
jgi:hypothetical protein